MRDPIVIEGLEPLAGMLLRHAKDLDYVVLDEVLHRQKRLQVARVAFTPADLVAYLEPDEAPDEPEEDDEAEEDVSDLPTEEGRSGRSRLAAEADSDLAHAALDDEDERLEEEEEDDDEGDETARLCQAVIRWIQAEVGAVMVNRPLCTFKLRLYRPKGGYVESRNFRAENPSYRPPRAQPPSTPSAPSPVPQGPTQAPSPASPPPAPQPPAPWTAPTPPTPLPSAPSPAQPWPSSAPAGPVPSAPVPPPSWPAPPQLPVVAPAPPPVLVPPPVQVVLPTPTPAPAPRNTPAVAIAFSGNGPAQLLYLDPDSIPEARVWRALGAATEDFLSRVGRTYGNIIELQSRTVTHQAEQLDKSQALVENLARQLLAARQVQETEEAENKADAQQLRIREELGKTFLSELGSFGRILATSKLGVAPELMELGDLVATSPELAEAIRDPNVRAMLKDEKTRKELAQLLLLASKKPGGGGPPPQAA